MIKPISPSSCYLLWDEVIFSALGFLTPSALGVVKSLK
jgi:hypothetical protein